MHLEPGMRVRCVDASGIVGKSCGLIEGCEYVTRIAKWESTVEKRISLEGFSGVFFPSRFKPIVRVKARTRVIHDACCNNAVPSRCKGCPLSTFHRGLQAFT